MECCNVSLLKTFRKICNRAIKIRNNDNAIICRTRNKLIVGSPLMALDKSDFVSKKIETISSSQRKAKECYKKEYEENGGLLVLLDKDMSDFFSDDVETSSDKYFDDNKVIKMTLVKKGIRYSILLFCHITVLRNKFKDDKYLFGSNIWIPYLVQHNWTIIVIQVGKIQMVCVTRNLRAKDVTSKIIISLWIN